MDHQNENTHEIIDIEDHAKEGKEIPESKSYRIRIDKQKYVVMAAEMTGSQLLTLAGKQPPERYSLYQKLRGGKTEKIEFNELADFRSPGVERFMTLALDQTEGAEPAECYPEYRHHFDLPEDDAVFLSTLGIPLETITERSIQRVVLYRYNLPSGYKQTHVDLNIRIERAYPDTQIDMVYFYPALNRVDGKPIKAICNDSFDGKIWQRWSRHRTPQNPWRPGVDNLETHLILIGEWLKQELGKM